MICIWHATQVVLMRAKFVNQECTIIYLQSFDLFLLHIHTNTRLHVNLFLRQAPFCNYMENDRQTHRLAPLCRLQHMIKDAIRPSYVASISNDAFSFRHQIYVAPDAKVKTPHKRPTATTYNLRYHWLIDFHDILVYYSLT